MGLVVLLADHKGSEDLARLADDLDLEIDEILPSTDFAEVLGLVTVVDGRVSLTDRGRKLLAGTIRERKTLLRDQLRRTTLFKALVRALDSSPERCLTDEEVHRLIEFTTAPADDLVQNIINWGRYAELFRYDSDRHVLVPMRTRGPGRSGPPGDGSPPTAVPATAEEDGAVHPSDPVREPIGRRTAVVG